MSTHDREDALARALDLLSEDDPARSDPRLLRNPELVAEARAAREIAADVWLAVSPLRAAPSDALPAILRKIGSPFETKPVSRWPLATGWAAAAAIALAWFVDREMEVSAPIPGHQGGENSVTVAPAERIPAMTGSHGERQPRDERTRLLRELTELRQAVQNESIPAKSGWSPRIIELLPPGTTSPDPDASRSRLMTAVSSALRGMLEIASGDDASLVIERGWFPGGSLELAENEWVRHRNFPVEEWSAYGLLMSEDGRFYDPEHALIWSSDSVSSDFIGRPVRAEDGNLAEFRHEVERPDEPTIGSQKFVEKAPSGFLIEDPATGEAHLLVEGLRPPPDGSSYRLIQTGATPGQGTTIDPGLVFDAGGSVGLISLSEFSTGGNSGFSLVQVNESGVTEAVIIRSGH
jgi:hypothetical protein